MEQAPGERKDWVAGVFDRAAETYDLIGTSYHAEFGRRLVDRARVTPGASVLDIACGRGAVLMPAVRAVGKQGHAVGTDISAEMVRLALEDSAQGGISNIDVLVMDAEDLAFADSKFDFVFCAFGLFFLPDPARAATEFARVLRPGGSLAVSTWAEEDPDWAWENELFGGLAVDRRPISQPFSTAESLHTLLDSADLEDVRLNSEGLTIRFADEDDWWAWKWSFSFRGVLEQLEADEVDRLRSSAFERMRSQRHPEGFEMKLRARFALATSPPLPKSIRRS